MVKNTYIVLTKDLSRNETLDKQGTIHKTIEEGGDRACIMTSEIFFIDKSCYRLANRVERIAYDKGLRNVNNISLNVPASQHWVINLAAGSYTHIDIRYNCYKELCEYMGFMEQYENYSNCSHAGYRHGTSVAGTHLPQNHDGMYFKDIDTFVDHVFDHWIICDLPDPELYPDGVDFVDQGIGGGISCKPAVGGIYLVTGDGLQTWIYEVTKIEDDRVWGINWVDIKDKDYSSGSAWMYDECTFRFLKSTAQLRWYKACVKKYQYISHDKDYKFIKKIKTHNKFPSTGFCKTSELKQHKIADFIFNMPSPYKKSRRVFLPNSIGIAWNERGYWYVIGTSSKYEYQWEYMEQLISNLSNNPLPIKEMKEQLINIKTVNKNENVLREISRPTERREHHGTRQPTIRRKPNSTTKRRTGVEKIVGKEKQRTEQTLRSRTDRLGSNFKLPGRYR